MSKRFLGIFSFVLMALFLGYLIFFETKNEHYRVKQQRIDFYHCPNHPWITNETPRFCPICKHKLVPVFETEKRKQHKAITIDSTILNRLGLKTYIVTTKLIAPQIKTIGKVGLEQNRQRFITTKFSGLVTKLYINHVGQIVTKGAPLFDIDSPELLTAQKEYHQAVQYHQKIKPSSDRAGIDLANDLLETAEKKLTNLGFSQSQMRALSSKNLRKKWTVYAPFSGQVTTLNMIQGREIYAGSHLLRLAETNPIWLHADIYDDEFPMTQIGDSVVIELADRKRHLLGMIAHINPSVEKANHTHDVLISYNQDYCLKEGMYLPLTIESSVQFHALTIPNEAIIKEGHRELVIKMIEKNKFLASDVVLGVQGDGYYEIKAGLKEGEKLVIKPKFFIDRKNNLKIDLGATSAVEKN